MDECFSLHVCASTFVTKPQFTQFRDVLEGFSSDGLALSERKWQAWWELEGLRQKRKICLFCSLSSCIQMGCVLPFPQWMSENARVFLTATWLWGTPQTHQAGATDAVCLVMRGSDYKTKACCVGSPWLLWWIATNLQAWNNLINSYLVRLSLVWVSLG